MDVLLTFLEGIITFVSPCLLPMLPIYVAYFSGGAGAGASEGGSGRGGVAQTLRSALGFVVGFGAVFTILGAFAGTLGAALVSHQRLLDACCGIVVMFLGLNYLGVLRVSVLNRTWRPASGVLPRSFGTSLLFGMVFAIGWTPCVGTFLASALSLAADEGSMARGVALLASYSLGLGVPFVVSALLVDQLEDALSWTRGHYGAIEKASGLLLVAVGLLMATGRLGALLRLLAG